MTAARHLVRIAGRDFTMGPAPAWLMRTAMPDILRLEQQALTANAQGDLRGAAEAAVNTLVAELALIAAALDPEVSAEDLEGELGYSEIAQLFARLVQMSSTTGFVPRWRN